MDVENFLFESGLRHCQGMKFSITDFFIFCVVRSAPNPILCSYIYYLEGQLFTSVLLNSCCKNFPKFTGEYLWWGGGSHCVKKYPNAEFFLVHIFFTP